MSDKNDMIDSLQALARSLSAVVTVAENLDTVNREEVAADLDDAMRKLDEVDVYSLRVMVDEIDSSVDQATSALADAIDKVRYG